MTELKKQRMLFLDDRTKRIESALRQYTDKYELTIVTNVKECLRQLCQKEFDIISLDHDLSGDDFQDPDDKSSGMEIVRYIQKCGGFPPTQLVIPEVWIHSSNLFAANLMINELLKVGIKGYFRKYEYDGEIERYGRSKAYIPKIGIDDWKTVGVSGDCVSCGKNDLVDNNRQCHQCYCRELISCG